MPLIPCPDCGKPTSRAAVACPACGHPFKPAATTHIGWWVGMGCLITALFTFCMMIIIGLLIWIGLTLQAPVDDGMGADEPPAQQEISDQADTVPAMTNGDAMAENPPPTKSKK